MSHQTVVQVFNRGSHKQNLLSAFAGVIWCGGSDGVGCGVLRAPSFLHTHSWLIWVDEDDDEVGSERKARTSGH